MVMFLWFVAAILFLWLFLTFMAFRVFILLIPVALLVYGGYSELDQKKMQVLRKHQSAKNLQKLQQERGNIKPDEVGIIKPRLDSFLSYGDKATLSLSGDITNKSDFTLLSFILRVRIDDCSMSECIRIGESSVTLYVKTPSKQKRRFTGYIDFFNLPKTNLKTVHWTYEVIGTRGVPNNPI